MSSLRLNTLPSGFREICVMKLAEKTLDLTRLKSDHEIQIQALCFSNKSGLTVRSWDSFERDKVAAYKKLRGAAANGSKLLTIDYAQLLESSPSFASIQKDFELEILFVGEPTEIKQLEGNAINLEQRILRPLDPAKSCSNCGQVQAMLREILDKMDILHQDLRKMQPCLKKIEALEKKVNDLSNAMCIVKPLLTHPNFRRQLKAHNLEAYLTNIQSNRPSCYLGRVNLLKVQGLSEDKLRKLKNYLVDGFFKTANHRHIIKTILLIVFDLDVMKAYRIPEDGKSRGESNPKARPALDSEQVRIIRDVMKVFDDDEGNCPFNFWHTVKEIFNQIGRDANCLKKCLYTKVGSLPREKLPIFDQVLDHELTREAPNEVEDDTMMMNEGNDVMMIESVCEVAAEEAEKAVSLECQIPVKTYSRKRRKDPRLKKDGQI